MPCGNIFYLFFRNQVRKELDIVRPCWQYNGEHRRFLLNFYWYSHMNRNDPTDVQPILISKHVELQPLQREHIAPLLEAAEDGQLWNNKWTLVPDAKKIDSYIDTALAGRLAKTMMPFAITRRDTGKVVGTTRLWKIDRSNRTLEIGNTWLGQSSQRTSINTETKFLLLTHAFEMMNMVRVQFMTDELNEKSRAAILRIGAREEGIIRHERIMSDGRKRNSVFFSIIDDEWPDVKARLLEKID